MADVTPAIENDPYFAQVAELLRELDGKVIALTDAARKRAEARAGVERFGELDDPTYAAAQDMSSVVRFLALRAKRLAAGGEQAAEAAADLASVSLHQFGVGAERVRTKGRA